MDHSLWIEFYSIYLLLLLTTKIYIFIVITIMICNLDTKIKMELNKYLIVLYSYMQKFVKDKYIWNENKN